jgi:hypothetical protein
MTKNVPLSRSMCKLLGHNENFSKGVSAETSHKSSQIHFHITFKTFKMKFQQKSPFSILNICQLRYCCIPNLTWNLKLKATYFRKLIFH